MTDARLRTQIMSELKTHDRQYKSIANDLDAAAEDQLSFYQSYHDLYNSRNALIEHDRTRHVLLKMAADSPRG
jgi:hypothetical protein